MENEQLKQYAEAAANALADGASEDDTIAALKQEGLKDEDIAKIMSIATHSAANAEPDTGAGADVIPLETAVQYIDGLGVDPQIVLAVLQIILKMDPDDVNQLAALLMQAVQQGQPQQGEEEGPMDGSGPNPGEGQGAGGPPQGQPRYEI